MGVIEHVSEGIRIVSDGTPSGTRVYGPDGVEIKGIRKIKVEAEAGRLSYATVTLNAPMADMRPDQFSFIGQADVADLLQVLRAVIGDARALAARFRVEVPDSVIDAEIQLAKMRRQ